MEYQGIAISRADSVYPLSYRQRWIKRMLDRSSVRLKHRRRHQERLELHHLRQYPVHLLRPPPPLPLQSNRTPNLRRIHLRQSLLRLLSVLFILSKPSIR